MVIFTTLKSKLLKSQNNTQIVELVYKSHHSWLLQVAFNFCQDREKAEDLVQELYVYLLEMKDIGKIGYNTTVNLFYLYKILKSKFLNQTKQNKKITVLAIEEDYLEIEDIEYNEALDQEFEKMLSITKELLETEVHWFDSKLLQTYINEKHSIASLHVATGISKSSIWTSLSKTKQYIRNSYDREKTSTPKEGNSN